MIACPDISAAFENSVINIKIIKISDYYFNNMYRQERSRININQFVLSHEEYVVSLNKHCLG